MNTEYILQAKPRESIGTATSKKIRRENGIPAVVYGDVDNSNIVLDANEVAKQVRDAGFYSSVIKLTIDKNTKLVLFLYVFGNFSRSRISNCRNGERTL